MAKMIQESTQKPKGSGKNMDLIDFILENRMKSKQKPKGQKGQKG